MLEPTLSEVDTLRWYLALSTPSEQQTDAGSEFNIASAFGRLLADSALIFPRIAHSFRVEGGEQADPEAGTVLTGPASGSFDLGADGIGRLRLDEEHALVFDANAGTIGIERGDRVLPIWGQEREDGQGGTRHAFHETAQFELPTVTRVVIETGPSPIRADAMSPALVTVTRGDASLSLRPLL